MIRPLTDTEAPALYRALDQLLEQARPQLVKPHQHLEPAADRAFESVADPERLVLIAPLGEGIIDARLHYPEPYSLTIAQIVVAPSARRRGLGRQLVRACWEAAVARGPVSQLCASILPGSPAGDFWRSLGFEAIGPRDFVRTTEPE